MRRRVVVLMVSVCAAVPLGGASSAFAAGPTDPTPTESDRLVAQALDLREAGKDREALPLLEQAAKLDPTPRKRAQLALGQQAMGQWVEAEKGLDGVLAPTGDPWVEQNRGALDQALATVRRQLGWLEVEGNVVGAEVTLNGAPLGTLPLGHAVRIPTGVCSLKVTAPGYVAVSRLVQIASGEHAREVLLLQPEAIVTAPIPDALLEARTRRRERGAAWAVLAGSGAALATGIVANVIRQSDADQYNALATSYNKDCIPHCPAAPAAPSHSDVDLFTGVAVAGYAASAVLGVTAAILFLRSAPHASARRTSAALETTRYDPWMTCGFGPTISCAGVF